MPVAVGMNRGGEDAERARELWGALARAFLRRRWRRTAVLRAGGGRATLWPLTQVLHAASLLEPLEADVGLPRLAAGLGCFDTRRGWAATGWPWPRRTVYYDDNAWLGLALAQAGLLDGLARRPMRARLDAIARRAGEVVRGGESAEGGVRWSERTEARHACSTAPAAMLALRLDGAGAGAFVARALEFLDVTLAAPGGLVADHITATGRIDPRVWSYNQGTTIGAHLLAWQVLGREASRRRAADLADAAVEHFTDGERLWRDPLVFAAVLVRQLLALEAHLPSARWVAFVDAYLERLWEEARVPETGLLTSGGIGHYEDGIVIDQAGAVQAFALRALPPEARRLAC